MSKILGLALFFSFSASAVVLKPIPKAPNQRLPIHENQPNYACSEVVDRLEKYNAMARSHDQSVNTFLGQVVEKAMSWYTALQPLENTTSTIEADTFLPVKEGGDEISEITNLAFDNSSLLAIELDRIIMSLKQCEFK